MSGVDNDQLASWQFNMQDERQYDFIRQKYADRRALMEQAAEARKKADSSQTVDGKPNPKHPALVLQADMAQLRFEMAYVVDKNNHLEAQVNILADLSQRVSILEGAYSHVKMVAETCRNYYHMVQSVLKKQDQKPKERT